ncbi:MAG: hypothetical protein KGY50_05125 [Candidatus Thermoplasmatota archaeon]|nr:hypothetical protein [Candidatus Thermoplasmatota archaeon]
MKGITNYEMREYFETISKDVKDIKTKKASTADTSLFLIATVTAITATLLSILYTHPVLLFFIISSLVSMAVILLKRQIESTD